MQPRVLYPGILSFRIEGEIKNFSGNQKLKEYSNTNHILNKILIVLWIGKKYEDIEWEKNTFGK